MGLETADRHFRNLVSIVRHDDSPHTEARPIAMSSLWYLQLATMKLLQRSGENYRQHVEQIRYHQCSPPFNEGISKTVSNILSVNLSSRLHCQSTGGKYSD